MCALKINNGLALQAQVVKKKEMEQSKGRVGIKKICFAGIDFVFASSHLCH